jgi:hypothetical protein
LEGSTVPHGMLEVSTVPEGVAHVLVVQALGVEDVVQRAFASVRSSSGARGGQSGAWTSSRGLFSQRLSGCWFVSRCGAAGVGFVPPMRS